jgi:hypothetical protein
MIESPHRMSFLTTLITMSIHHLNEKAPSPYTGHWLHGPPRWKLKVWYPILLREDGTAEFVDAFSAFTSTKHPDPGGKDGAWILSNTRLFSFCPRDNPPLKRELWFRRLISEFIIPVEVSGKLRARIVKANTQFYLDGWEYKARNCQPIDRLLEKELAPQLKGKLLTDPIRVFAGG